MRTITIQPMTKKSIKLQAIDLFCGAGGLSLGMHWAGFDVVLALDNWDSAIKTYNTNFSLEIGPLKLDKKLERLESTLQDKTGSSKDDDVAIKVNINSIDGSWIRKLLKNNDLDPEIDVVVGGPPCQGFSMAGRRNPKDQRNALVWEFLRIVKELRPKVFLMENVKGLASARTPEGENVPLKIKEVCEKMDYQVTWNIIDASKHGVPQMRQRIFFVGVDERWTADVPCTFPNLKEREIITVRDALSDLPSPSFSEPIPYAAEPQTRYQEWIRTDSSKLYHHLATRHRPDIITKLKKLSPGQPLYPHYKDAWKRLEWDKPSFTVKENHNAPGVHPEQPRVITPRECARLQSFPDNFLFPCPKSTQLKLIGNAVPPLLARELGQSILEQYLL